MTLPTESAKPSRFGFRIADDSPRAVEEQTRIVEHLLTTEINPMVAGHGGRFTLVKVENNNVYVTLGGGCQGCGMADVTLKQGFETRLRQLLPEMDQLVDVTDHQSGSNPFYP
ncbi:MAG: NifU family protein [Deltaproteobacteria bacterium]|nr:NifU family protein [Deltaproteobacteria bacterium]